MKKIKIKNLFERELGTIVNKANNHNRTIKIHNFGLYRKVNYLVAENKCVLKVGKESIYLGKPTKSNLKLDKN